MSISTTSHSGTKEKIRRNAIELFKMHGYNNVTVMQICEASGVTKRTFYYHFSSKEEIVDGIVGHVGKKAELMAEAMLRQESNVGILWAMMRSYAVEAEENGPAITSQFYINVLQRGGDGAFPQDMLLYKAVVQSVSNAQRAGEIANKQPAEDVAYALYHALRSATYTWCSSGGRSSLIAEYMHVFQVVLELRISLEKAFGTDA